MLNKKFLVHATLIVLVLLFVGISYNSPGAKAEKKVVPANTQIQKKDGIIVYYFYAKPRCVSCKKIETYTQESVSALNNSKVVYKAIDLDDSANKHYMKDYKLFTKAVVLSEIKNGEEVKSKNLVDIWTKLGDEKAFKGYVTREIKTYLGD
jgi:thiol-disulfide isomerase/thioredoxin